MQAGCLGIKYSLILAAFSFNILAKCFCFIEIHMLPPQCSRYLPS